jgi:hypothetical protein
MTWKEWTRNNFILPRATGLLDCPLDTPKAIAIRHSRHESGANRVFLDIRDRLLQLNPIAVITHNHPGPKLIKLELRLAK